MYNPKVPIGFRIAQIKLLQGRIFESMLKGYPNISLNNSQASILFYLWEEDGITISELSKRTDLAKTTLTSMLDRLEQGGWIRRETNPENRREIKITLSETAFEVKSECYEIFQEMMGITMNGLQENEREELSQYLERIYHNLTEYERTQK